MDDGINHDRRRRKVVNRLVARKRYAASEHSSSHLKEDHNSLLTISKQFLVQLAFIFIMVINVIISGLNMNLLKLVWVVGLTAVVCGSAGCVESAVEPHTVPRDSFGGKHFNAYILPSTNVYASWMNYFDRYIKNLESEYRTMKFYKLAYLYIYMLLILRGYHGSLQPFQVRLQPWHAIYCILWFIYYQNGVM